MVARELQIFSTGLSSDDFRGYSKSVMLSGVGNPLKPDMLPDR
jgi:hypothetical protein